MKTRAKVFKFGPQNKKLIKGKIKHTRTGACTSRGKCFHGKTKNR